MVVSLPLEIAFPIVQEAARTPGQDATRLLYVSKLIKSWVEPILYSTVFLYTPDHVSSFARTTTSESSSASRLAQFVIHVVVFSRLTRDHEGLLGVILEKCSKLTYLAVHTPDMPWLWNRGTDVYLQLTKLTLFSPYSMHAVNSTVSYYAKLLYVRHLHLVNPSRQILSFLSSKPGKKEQVLLLEQLVIEVAWDRTVFEYIGEDAVVEFSTIRDFLQEVVREETRLPPMCTIMVKVRAPVDLPDSFEALVSSWRNNFRVGVVDRIVAPEPHVGKTMDVVSFFSPVRGAVEEVIELWERGPL